MNRDETVLHVIIIYIPKNIHLHLSLKKISRNIVITK